MAVKIDATRPLYAVVGAGDLAVELARTAANDVTSRFAKVELQPKALRDQARTVVSTRIDVLAEDAKGAQAKVESRLAEPRPTPRRCRPRWSPTSTRPSPRRTRPTATSPPARSWA